MEVIIIQEIIILEVELMPLTEEWFQNLAPNRGFNRVEYRITKNSTKKMTFILEEGFLEIKIQMVGPTKQQPSQ